MAIKYIGDVSYRETSAVETRNKSSFDTLTLTRKGDATGLDAEASLYKTGSSPAEYAGMFLWTKVKTDAGPFGKLVLTYRGFLGEADSDNGYVSQSDNINLSSVSLGTDEGESVQFLYYSQTLTTKWLYYGQSKPTSPRYRITVDTTIGVGNLFKPDPATFQGNIAFNNVARLVQFSNEELAPEVWGVVESWSQMIEPVTPIVEV